MSNPTMELDLRKRYQAMQILWFALLLSIAICFVIAKFAGSSSESAAPQLPIVIINGTGVLIVCASFLVKGKLLKRSVEEQNPLLVQSAMILAMAMCESCALLGVLQRFAFGNREYYLVFILAVAADLFHFPRLSQLEAASYKSKNPW